MNKKPTHKIRAAVVVYDVERGGVLLARQNQYPFWVFPGGTLEAGETVAQCAVRELKEETGFIVELTGLCDVHTFIKNEQTETQTTVDVFYWGRIVGGKLEMETSENLDALEFISLEACQHMAIEPQAVAAVVLTQLQ